jgi:hypothetical protein
MQIYASQPRLVNPEGNALISSSKLALFMVWGLLPYFCMAAPLYIFHFPARSISTYLMGVLVATSLGVYGYVRSILFTVNPDSVLIFVIMPICQHLGGALSFALVLLFNRKEEWHETHV